MKQGNPLQLGWGIALIAAGIGVVVRMSTVMPKILGIPQFAGAEFVVRASFYIMAAILVGGGVKKVKNHLNGESDE